MPNIITSALRRVALRFAGGTPAAPALRRFEAAAVNRLTESWLATQRTIDDELRNDLDRLRRRSRDLAKNNEYMGKFLRMVRNNVIGQGMTLQSRPMDGATPDVLAGAAIERHLGEWAKPKNCDAAGRSGLWTMMRAACDAAARDGEILLRLRPGLGAYGLRLQLLDVERLDTTYNEASIAGRNAVIMGVEVDADHRPVAYHLLRQRPGALTGTELRGQRDRVPADEIIHAFVPLEPEQTRGVPWAHAAMRRLNDLGGYREAAVIAARIGAAKMGFFTSPEADTLPSDGKDAEGVPYTTAEPGQFGVLPPGVNFQTFDPSYPHEQFGEFTKATLRGIASGLGVAYNSLSNDLEGVNFSSIRSGVLEERDEWMVLQEWFIEQVLDPIFDQWLRLALAAGAITQISSKGSSALPLAKKEKFAAHIWMPRRWGWVDPLKDVQATVLAIENDLTTATDAAARAGVDIEDVFITKQREEELRAQYGIAKPQGKGKAAQGSQQQQQQQGRALAPAANPEADETMRMARANIAAGKTVELALRVEAPAEPHPAPIINVAAPVVNVAPPQVNVTNEVQPTAVAVNVAAPVVNLEAALPEPVVNVALEMPARRTDTTIERDAAGRIVRSSSVEAQA